MLNTRDDLDKKSPLLLKVCVIGHLAAGKTELVNAASGRLHFSKTYKATVGVDFADFLNKEINTRLQLWDIQGKEQFQSMLPAYYKNSAAAIICYDPSRPLGYNAVKRLADSFKENTKSDTPPAIILVSTKSDLDDLSAEERRSMLEKKATEIGAIATYDLSAKNSNDVIKAFNNIAEILFNLHYDRPLIAPTAAAILPIYHTAYFLIKSPFKTHDSWVNKLNLDDDELLEEMKKQPDSSLTAKAVRWHKEYFEWNYPDGNNHEEHYVGIYNAMRKYAYEKSFAKNMPEHAHTKKEIEKKAQDKPHSGARVFVNNMRIIKPTFAAPITQNQLPLNGKTEIKIILTGSGLLVNGKTHLPTRYEGSNFILNITTLSIEGLQTKTQFRDILISNANIAVICYDLTQPSPVKSYADYIKKLLPNIQLAIVKTNANSTPENRKEDFANERNLIEHFDVNAQLDSTNVKPIFDAIAEKLTALYLEKTGVRPEDHDANLDALDTLADQERANRIKRIYLAGRALKLFNKKDSAWAIDDSATIDDMEDHAARDHSLTAKAIELDNKFNNWDNPRSDSQEKDYVGLYNALREYTHGLFKKTPFNATSVAEITTHANRKPLSATSIYVKTLNGSNKL